MHDIKTHTMPPQKPAIAPGERPQEKGNIVVQAHVKIHDPHSKKVYFEGRA